MRSGQGNGMGLSSLPGGSVTTKAEVFATEIRQMLDERFGNEFKFGPIVVWSDQDDDISFLRTYLVFDGDVDKLIPQKRRPWKVTSGPVLSNWDTRGSLHSVRFESSAAGRTLVFARSSTRLGSNVSEQTLCQACRQRFAQKAHMAQGQADPMRLNYHGDCQYEAFYYVLCPALAQCVPLP